MTTESSTRFDVVGIGASAGGVPALMLVIKALPSDFPCAVLVVQHLSPNVKSHLAFLLGRHARLPVQEAEFAEPILPGHVYTAPPDTHLLVTDRRVSLTRSKLVQYVRPSIDLLFESIADTYESRSVGVILTGSGVDGAVGLEMIKKKGGITIVQDPSEAEYRRMPDAALGTGCVDFTLPLQDIAPTIVRLLVESVPPIEPRVVR